MTNTITKITYDWDEYKVWAEYTAGTWISITSNQISNTWVTSFNWNTWTVTYTAPVTSVNGSTWAVTVSAVPTVWTNGQVLTVVSWAAAWANASGWDVKVSSQAHNLLTTGMKIWCGTEGDYANLGTYDSNSLYLTVPWAATPGWTPWANTLAYWKFDWNLNDSSGNGVTFLWTPYGYSTWIDWQALENTNNVQLDSSLTQWDIYSWAFTIAFCVNMQNSSSIQRIFAYGGSPSWSVDLQYEFYNDFSGFQVYTNGLAQRIAFPLANPWIWVWKNIVVTGDGVNQIECYIDGVKTNAYNDYNTTFTYPSQSTSFSIRWSDGANNLLDWVIIENKHWTQSDVDLYLNTYPVS
jgi:hypothetical protein